MEFTLLPVDKPMPKDLPNTYAVRAAHPADFIDIQRVEVGAAERFRAVRLAFIAEAPPLPLERLMEFERAGGLHVLTHQGRVVGFSAHCFVDGAGYLAELDVLAAHAGRRLGLRLLHHVEACVHAAGCDRLWLTTYRDVPWNGPYYERAGFEESCPAAGSKLAQRLHDEQAGPLGAQPRVAMVKRLEQRR